MTGRMWLLLSWTVLGAVLLVMHVTVLAGVARAERPPLRYRWLALIPPVAPVLAWVGGYRMRAVIWTVLLVIYVVLRLLEGVI